MLLLRVAKRELGKEYGPGSECGFQMVSHDVNVFRSKKVVIVCL